MTTPGMAARQAVDELESVIAGYQRQIWTHEGEIERLERLARIYGDRLEATRRLVEIADGHAADVLGRVEG